MNPNHSTATRTQSLQQSSPASSDAAAREAQTNGAAPRVISAGEWLRLMTGFQAPFGHDGMPTVWG
jgi:hypothetical protein